MRDWQQGLGECEVVVLETIAEMTQVAKHKLNLHPLIVMLKWWSSTWYRALVRHNVRVVKSEDHTLGHKTFIAPFYFS